MILTPLLSTSPYSVENSVSVLRKEISSSFQKSIGLTAFHELCQHDFRIKQHSSLNSLTSMHHWRHMFTTYSTDAMTSDWMTSYIQLNTKTIACWRHSSDIASFFYLFESKLIAQKMLLGANFLVAFFIQKKEPAQKQCASFCENSKSYWSTGEEEFLTPRSMLREKAYYINYIGYRI